MYKQMMSNVYFIIDDFILQRKPTIFAFQWNHPLLITRVATTAPRLFRWSSTSCHGWPFLPCQNQNKLDRAPVSGTNRFKQLHYEKNVFFSCTPISFFLNSIREIAFDWLCVQIRAFDWLIEMLSNFGHVWQKIMFIVIP